MRQVSARSSPSLVTASSISTVWGALIRSSCKSPRIRYAAEFVHPTPSRASPRSRVCPPSRPIRPCPEPSTRQRAREQTRHPFAHRRRTNRASRHPTQDRSPVARRTLSRPAVARLVASSPSLLPDAFLSTDYSASRRRFQEPLRTSTGRLRRRRRDGRAHQARDDYRRRGARAGARSRRWDGCHGRRSRQDAGARRGQRGSGANGRTGRRAGSFYAWWAAEGAIAGAPRHAHPARPELGLLYVGISPAHPSIGRDHSLPGARTAPSRQHILVDVPLRARVAPAGGAGVDAAQRREQGRARPRRQRASASGSSGTYARSGSSASGCGRSRAKSSPSYSRRSTPPGTAITPSTSASAPPARPSALRLACSRPHLSLLSRQQGPARDGFDLRPKETRQRRLNPASQRCPDSPGVAGSQVRRKSRVCCPKATRCRSRSG